MAWIPRFGFGLAVFALCQALHAGEKAPAAPLTVQRIFGSREFEPQRVSIQWIEGGLAYTTVEPATGPGSGGGSNIVRHDPKTGATTIMVPAELLIPAGTQTSLGIDDYTFSSDRSKLLIFTNSRRVWRTNTKGDYWVLDRTSRELHKLGGDAPPATLMHAKFAPDATQVAYVRANDIYVEDLRDHQVVRLTYSASRDEINGTFDWVYEEELGLRDGFRWSPDGQSIAYWNINTAGVREFPLVNNTDSFYPRIVPIKYPKAGEVNAACRVGVVPVRGGATRWIDTPGDPRNHYIAFMEWIGNSDSLLLQQFNRLQNTVAVMTTNPRNGSVTTVLTDRDDAWIDQQTEVRWIHDHQEFLWLSERDGWRHIYRVSRKGGNPVLITAGDFDVMDILGVDPKADWIYFSASPENPTQRYLYKVHADGTGLGRVTPAGEAGSHEYQISPDARWAVDRFSNFDTIPRTTLVSLPSHETIRVISDNKAVMAKLGETERGRTEFFRVDIGDGIKLDGWCIYPPRFDPKLKYPLLIHVYGEPAAQTVVDRWGGGTYLWHQMLAQAGYIVMSFDNRGTPAPAAAPGASRSTARLAFSLPGIKRPLCETSCAHGLISTPIASASGDGAAAARCRSMRSSNFPIFTRRQSPWHRSPISVITTRSIKNATWDCPATTSRATHKARPSISRTSSKATCS